MFENRLLLASLNVILCSVSCIFGALVLIAFRNSFVSFLPFSLALSTGTLIYAALVSLWQEGNKAIEDSPIWSTHPKLYFLFWFFIGSLIPIAMKFILRKIYTNYDEHNHHHHHHHHHLPLEFTQEGYGTFNNNNNNNNTNDTALIKSPGGASDEDSEVTATGGGGCCHKTNPGGAGNISSTYQVYEFVEECPKGSKCTKSDCEREECSGGEECSGQECTDSQLCESEHGGGHNDDDDDDDNDSQDSCEVKADRFNIGLSTAISISLHKMPEAFLLFATSALYPPTTALTFVLFFTMVIHNAAEGIAIAAPLYIATRNIKRTFWITFLLGGLSQPLGGFIGFIVFEVSKETAFVHQNLFGPLFSAVSGMLCVIIFDGMLPLVFSYLGHSHHYNKESEEKQHGQEEVEEASMDPEEGTRLIGDKSHHHERPKIPRYIIGLGLFSGILIMVCVETIVSLVES